jgi:hypothetical protein
MEQSDWPHDVARSRSLASSATDTCALARYARRVWCSTSSVCLLSSWLDVSHCHHSACPRVAFTWLRRLSSSQPEMKSKWMGLAVVVRVVREGPDRRNGEHRKHICV